MASSLEEPVVAQTGRSGVAPRHLRTVDFLSPEQMRSLAGKARAIVSHAGIGSVLMAQNAGKPLVLFPRDSALGEHRTDHQFATCRELAKLPGLYVAKDEAELKELLLSDTLEPAKASVDSVRLQQLVSGLRAYFAECAART